METINFKQFMKKSNKTNIQSVVIDLNESVSDRVIYITFIFCVAVVGYASVDIIRNIGGVPLGGMIK